MVEANQFGMGSKAFKSARAKRASAVLAMAASGLLTQFTLADATWVGGTSQSWNDGTNWSVNPPTGNLTVNTAVGNFPVLNADSVFTPVDLIIGNAASGRFDHTAGTLSNGTGNWMFVGQGAAGVGTWNLANTATTGGSLTGFGLGSGSANVGGTSTTSGRLYLGNGSSSTGTLNMNTSGTLKLEDDAISLLMGNGGTSLGNLNLDAGTLQINSVNTTGIGILAGTNGGDANFKMSGGTVNVTGGVWAGDNNVNSQGLIQIDGGTFNSTSTGTGTQAGQVFIGRGAGQGTFTQNGGTVNLSVGGGAVNIGYSVTATAGTAGTMNLNGGTFTTGGEVRVGTSASNSVATVGSGTLNIAGGTATVGALTVGRGNDNTDKVTGVVNVSSGTLTSTGGVILGFAGAANSGTLNVSNTGTFNVGTSAATTLSVSVYDTSNGNVNVSGGNLNLNSGSSIRFTTGNTGTVSTNTITQSGGNVTFYGDNATTVGGTGVLDLQNSGAAGVKNTYNLDGGTLTVPQIISTLKTGTRTFNFNGGTLKAATSGTPALNFMNANTVNTANVRNGGAIIDTNGINATMGQALVHSTVSGDNAIDGGLTKNGAGTLTLTGAASYTGATTVNAGTLGFASAQSNLSNITVANGAGLGAQAINGTSALNVNGLSFGTSSLAFDFNGLANPTVPMINASAGSLTLNGTLNISLFGGGGLSTTPNNTTIPLLTYGSLAGPGSFNLATPSAGHTTYALNPTANTLYLSVTALSNAWTGAVNGNWDINSTLNWSAPDSKYLEGDNVVFNDSGVRTNVNIASTVNPTSVTFANTAAKTYTLTGASIAGPGYVLVNGGGTAVILNSNSYTGSTTIAAGSTLQLGNGTAGNDGVLTSTSGVIDNGTLVYNRAGANTAAYTISGTGGVVVTGAGSQTFSGVNSYSGGLTVNAGGTVKVATDAALGAAGSGISLDNGTLVTTGGFINSHPISIGSNGGLINVTTAGQLYLNAPNLLTGSGPLTVTGNGTLTANVGNVRIDQANSYNGPVTLRSGGIFEYGALGAVDAATTFTVQNEGEISVQNATAMPNSVTVTGGTNSVLSFENGNTGNYAGPVTLNANAIVGLRDWYNNGTVRSGIISGVVSGSGALTVNSGTGTGGTLTLSAANTYTGGTTVNASKVLAGNDAAFGTGAVSIGGTNAQVLLANGVNVANALTINGGGATSQGALFIGDTTTATYSGPISVTATQTAGGTFGAGANSVLTLSGPIASTVPLTVRTGTVVFSNPNGTSTFGQIQGTGNNGVKTIALGANNALPTGVTLDIGATGVTGTVFDLAGYNQTVSVLRGTGGTVTNSLASTASTLTTTGVSATNGIIQDGAGVTAIKVAGGSLNLTGANTYTGTTTVAGGTLTANSVAYANLLANAGGIDFGNTGSSKVVLDYTGTSSPVAQVKSILDAGYAGGFATGQIRATTLSGGRTIGYSDDGLSVVNIRVTLPGDANLDGSVDFNDFLVLQNNFSLPDTRFDQGNFNYDGLTDFNDFLVLQNNFGQSVTGVVPAITQAQVAAITAFASTAAVPEPTTLAVLGIGSGMLLRRRRR